MMSPWAFRTAELVWVGALGEASDTPGRLFQVRSSRESLQVSPAER